MVNGMSVPVGSEILILEFRKQTLEMAEVIKVCYFLFRKFTYCNLSPTLLFAAMAHEVVVSWEPKVVTATKILLSITV